MGAHDMHCPSRLAYEFCQTFLADLAGEVAVFRAFLDESGTHDGSPVITVAGYVARPKAWREFVPRWNRTLKPIAVFHSSECNGFHGEWNGWAREARDAKVKQLLSLLPSINGVGLAVGIVQRDLKEALNVRPHLQPYWPSSYEACCQWWISIMLQRMQERGNREPLAIVHEENQYGNEAHSAYTYVRENHDHFGQLISFSFGKKSDFVPLQAADILAYEIHKRLQDIEGNPRKSFEVMMKEEFEPEIRFYDKENLGPLISTLEMFRALDVAETLAPAFVRRQS